MIGGDTCKECISEKVKAVKEEAHKEYKEVVVGEGGGGGGKATAVTVVQRRWGREPTYTKATESHRTRVQSLCCNLNSLTLGLVHTDTSSTQ